MAIRQIVSVSHIWLGSDHSVPNRIIRKVHIPVLIDLDLDDGFQAMKVIVGVIIEMSIFQVWHSNL